MGTHRSLRPQGGEGEGENWGVLHSRQQRRWQRSNVFSEVPTSLFLLAVDVVCTSCAQGRARSVRQGQVSRAHLARRLLLSVPHTMLKSGPCPRCLRTRAAIASSFLSTLSIVERISERTCAATTTSTAFEQSICASVEGKDTWLWLL